MPPSSLRIGLTGGIASGKSAAAEAFAALGIQLIDADVIARELVEPGTAALGQIVACFGSEVLGPDGRLDRRRLRERVFADAGLRRQLDAILHPAIHAALQQRSREARGPYHVLVVPLLVENGLQSLVDRVVVVDAPDDVRMQRLMARDSIDASRARQMLAAQASREERLSAADDVITNTGSLDDLKAEVLRLHHRYLAMQGSGPHPPSHRRRRAAE